MTKVRVLKTIPGSPDGIRVCEYVKGEEYDEHSSPPMTQHLRDVLIPAGLAEEVAETKAVTGPTDNKALNPATENKGARRKSKAGDN